MKQWLKAVWDKVRGVVKSILDQVLDRVLDKAQEIVKDRELVGLALEAVKFAAKSGLKGDDAWTVARDAFVAELKTAGRELGDCAIDTTLQLTYAAWKDGK